MGVFDDKVDGISVWCTFQAEGVHFWPDAPEGSFLRHPHRHLFKGRLEAEVEHDDREIEFIKLASHAGRYLKEALAEEGVSHSCEALARYVLACARRDYGSLRRYEVIVSEDGENGARVFREAGGKRE